MAVRLPLHAKDSFSIGITNAIIMAKGKQTCKILKEIRKQIAAENDIQLVIEECTYKGDCLGTCPKCEAEVRYLERELEKRQRMGKAAVFAGMTLGTLFGATSCHEIIHPLEGDVPYTPDSTEMSNDTIQSDTITDEPFLLEGDVLAPEPDSLEEDGETTEGFVVPNTNMSVEDEQRSDVYMFVDQMPEFPGGEAKLMEFISKNIHYPQAAREKGIQGRVFIGFIIEKDGSVSNVRNLRSVDSELDAEAMRVIESMPRWKPGMLNGDTVRVSYQIPIVFKLEDE